MSPDVVVSRARRWREPQSPMMYKASFPASLLKRFMVACDRLSLSRTATLNALIEEFCDAVGPHGPLAPAEPTLRIEYAEEEA